MLVKTFTATMDGLNVVPIDVEIVANQGQPNLIIIGLPSKTVDEAKERITAALRNCGIRIRSKRTVVNLAPADIKKDSSCLELAIAIGLLKLYEEIDNQTDSTIFLGELSLDGELKKIRGALPLVMKAKELGFQHVIIPAANSEEVSIISDISIHPLHHIKEYLDFARGIEALPTLVVKFFSPEGISFDIDLAEIAGQGQAKRAMEIAAAGGHNLLMMGPPGAGKSMMAKSIVSILPPLTEPEAIEITTIYSICGLAHEGLIRKRPFRSPHHTTSYVGLIGGGTNLKPGEVSLSHHGVLFLDELPEFFRNSIEALRQPLEDGFISLSRASGSISYPAAFTLIAAANPCPCGFYQSTKKTCSCVPRTLDLYKRKLSGPILDRIDIKIKVPEVEIKALTQTQLAGIEKSDEVRNRVTSARQIQQHRLAATNCLLNSQLTSTQVKNICQLEPQAKDFLDKAAEKNALSARSYFKVIKVSQTIADLNHEAIITQKSVAESFQYRQQLM
jgi:magnesium chelatase family protein